MKKVFLKISQNSQENTFGLRDFSKTSFLQNTSGRMLLAFRATLLKWGTANVWETSDEYSLPRSTNLRSTVISFLFFRQDKLSVYVFIGFTLLLPKAAIRVEAFCKKRCSKIFRKFHRKTPVLESLFDKVASLTPILKNISQRLLLHCTCTTHSYLSVLLYIQHLLHHHHCYQIQKVSKNLNLVSHFH